jgi:glycosyltransferase involved in cell wall biosynthesis
MLINIKQNTLNILHISTFDIKGGAARAAYRLHQGQLREGLCSSMLVSEGHSTDSSITMISPPSDLNKRLYRVLRREMINRSFNRYQSLRPAGLEIFSDDRSQYKNISFPLLSNTHIINLHWIARFIDYKSFFRSLPEQIPIVWTLHDMNPFTGGCHYDNDCTKYRKKCGRCPQLGSKKEFDLSRRIWKRKNQIFRQMDPGRIHIVAPNKWMAETVKSSQLLRKFPVTMIPYGVDTQVFSPRCRQLARNSLEVPKDAKVILFVADSLSNDRKGFKFIVEALNGISNIKKLFLLSIGNGQVISNLQIPHLNFGHIDNDRLLSLVYSAADLFVIPSIQDNLPNTVLEAMSCGTPVIGFNVGGIPDMVRNDETGCLIPPKNIVALRSTIVHLLRHPQTIQNLGMTCRQTALQDYSIKIQAKQYFELYKNILDQAKI